LLAGNRSLLSLCLLLFLVSGLISFWYFFPADVIQRSLLRELTRQTGLKMEGSEAEMLFPVGLGLDLKVYPGQAEFAPLMFTEMQLTPAWSRLLTGSAAADVEAFLAGGTVEALFARSGQLQLDLADIEVAPLQQADLPYRLQGKLAGKLDAEKMMPALDGKGQFNLQLSNASVDGLDRVSLPARMALGILQLEGKFNQRRLSLEKVLLTGGVIEMTGGGTLLLAETPEQTRINMNVRLHPNQSTPDSLRDLLSLTGVKPTTDGSYLLRIAGTLSRPTLR
jgi:type II secretion system protein N